LGGEFLLKLNTGWSPIAYKYCEGKLQRTLERELKVPETVNGEGFERAAPSVCSSVGFCDNAGRNRSLGSGLLVALWLLVVYSGMVVRLGVTAARLPANWCQGTVFGLCFWTKFVGDCNGCTFSPRGEFGTARGWLGLLFVVVGCHSLLLHFTSACTSLFWPSG